MKDFDFVIGFADLIVDEKRTVQQFADKVSFFNNAAHSREASQQFDVSDKRTAKARGRLCVILGNVAKNLREII